jgi:hypothetical protein
LQPPAFCAVEGGIHERILKETLMLKGVVGLAAVLVVAGSVQTQAPAQETPDPGALRQDASHRRLRQADLNALTDARIGVAKAMLQMTPEQAKFWPPIEEAIRNGAEARYRRIAQLRAHGGPGRGARA